MSKNKASRDKKPKLPFLTFPKEYLPADHVAAVCACGPTQFAEEIIVSTNSANQTAKQITPSVLDTKKEKVQKAPNKFALLIGINDYGTPSNNLMGCLNDVKLVKANLTKTFGLMSKNIKIILDQKATKKAMLKGIHWLVSNRKPNDVLAIHFSGHGTWTLLQNGKGWEVAMCCADYFKGRDRFVISNTEFYTALMRKNGRLFGTFDCCFAGGLSPYRRPWRRLPAKVRKLLYGNGGSDANTKGMRAIRGPEWVSISKAAAEMHVSRESVKTLIAEGKLQHRELRPGLTYLRMP